MRRRACPAPAARILAVRLLAGFVLAVPALLAPGPAAAVGQPGAEAAVRVDITDLTRVLRPGEPVTVTGLVTNTGPVGLSDVRVSLGLGARLVARSALAAARATPPAALPQVVAPLRTSTAGLPPGAGVRFSVSVPSPSALGLRGDQPGVHPFAVVATGTADGVRQELGRANTFLPYFATSPLAPLRTALVLPVTNPPDGAPTGTQAMDSALVAALSPGGRLDTLLRGALAAAPAGAAGPARITLALDPALLAAVCRAATACGQRGGPGVPAATPAAAAAAKGWLDLLVRAAAAPGIAVSALPYGDADLVALARGGDEAAADGRRLLADAPRLVQDVTGSARSTPTLDPVVPVDGVLTRPAVDLVRSAGARLAVVSDELLPPPPEQAGAPGAPTAVSTLGGTPGAPPLRVLVTDRTLQDLLVRATTPPSTPRLAEQDLLAETAFLTSQRPNDASVRSLVLVAPREWAPPPEFLTALVGDLAAVPWLASVSIDAAAAGTVVPRTRAVDAGTVANAAEAARLDTVAPLRAQVLALRELARFPDREMLSPPLAEALDRSESAAWRGAGAAAGGAILAQVGHEVGALLDKVTLGVSREGVTLTGPSGPLAVQLGNGLPEEVVVRAVLESVPPGQVTRVDRTFPPIPAVAPDGTPTRLQDQVVVTARATGPIPVQLRVLTASGVQVGEPYPLRITSTAYGVVAVGITAGALTVLVLAFVVRGVRWLRRRRPAGAGAGTA